MNKGMLKTINYMSLRIEEYIEKAFKPMMNESKTTHTNAIINLQKAYLINICMREMVENQIEGD